jgi:hypothetical protein
MSDETQVCPRCNDYEFQNVPVEVLEDLRDEWLDIATERPFDDGQDNAYRHAADELQEVIDDYE